MKTHFISEKIEDFIILCPSNINLDSELISALRSIATLLKNSPNIEIEQSKLMKKTDNLAVTLKALSSLSKYTKQQWVSVIGEFGLDIELNPRASSRDVLGKVLAYLDENPDVLKKFEKKNRPVSRNKNETSLEDTLSKLINYK